jgi:hypothetical protein
LLAANSFAFERAKKFAEWMIKSGKSKRRFRPQISQIFADSKLKQSVRELGFRKSADVFPVSESIRTPLPATLN